MVAGNKDSKYQLPETEVDYVHVRMKGNIFNEDGTPNIPPFIQKFTPRDWQQMKDSRILEGYKTELLHVPDGVVGSPKKQEPEVEGKTDKWNELAKEYKELVGEDPDPELTTNQLKSQIKQIQE